MPKYTIISLGCSKNLVDSERFSYIIDQTDFQMTSKPEEADVIIINTCGFILDAKEESLDVILEALELKKKYKNKKVIVTGCLIERYKTEIQRSIPEIDEIVDLKDFDHFANIFNIQKSNERKLLTPAHYAYLRISDGCNNNCSYCVIPQIRGKLKSVPIPQLVKEARKLAEIGVKELIITAQDTAAYGMDLYTENKISQLLEKLHEIDKIQWIRILYLHPAHISEDIINTISKLPKICKYFEIPIQHINNEILESMNRKVSKVDISSIVSKIRSKIPEAVIRTTLITGYPSETEKKFQELKQFISNIKFERLGVFPYSPEEGSKSVTLPDQVPKETAERRQGTLLNIQQEISSEFLASMIGKKIKVIIDRYSKHDSYKYEARSYFDAPDIDGLVFISSGEVAIGDIVTVEIIDSMEFNLIGELET